MNRRLAPAILGVLVLLLACTDLIGPRGGNSVRLVVQPSFGQVPATAAADNPASRVDNVHVVLLNAAGATVLDTIIEWPLNQDTLRMDLDVVVQERESFELTIQGRSGDRVLFQAGPMSLELSEDDSGSTVATSPVLEYAGPGAEVAGVEITGAPGTFIAGSAVELGAVGTNDDGSDAGDLLIVWTSLNPDAATVGDDGRVQVGHDASRAVSIEGRVAFTTIADTIGGPVLPAELSLSPDASTLTALGAELSLTAALLGEDGGNVTGVDIEWSVADASVLGLATEGDGGGAAVATARTRGATRVFATAGELTASADVTVEQAVARLEVDPDSAALARVNTNLQATATAFDANDNEIEDAEVTWSSGDPDVATVADDGTITAVSPGTARITAASDEAADSLRATVANAAPEVAIIAPSDGATFEEGDTVTFEATAEDLEDGDLSASIEWVSDNPGELGTGASVRAELEPGAHTVTATVVDAHGDAASASMAVTVNPNTAPIVSITAPSEAITVSYGTEVALEAAAEDEQEGDLSSSIEWISDLDGELGAGASVSVDDLSIGNHTITASASDSRELTASATRRVEVTNNAPEVAITAPADGATYEEGASVTFQGAGDDVEDGNLTGNILWSSDLDGELGAGASATAALSNGTHTVTATVTDTDDATTSAFVKVTVNPNTPPTVSITAPSEATAVSYGTELTLKAAAGDEQDGDLSGSIEWSSDLDGELGAGARVVAGGLSIGAHTITASVSDSRELTASATRRVEVTNNAPEVAIAVPADGATYDEGENTTFEGAAEDVEDGDLSEAIAWSSDLDGELGNGASITVALSNGIHEITATVTDRDAGSASAVIEVTVAANTAPEVSILAPEAGTSGPFGSPMNFEGTATDEQDGELDGAIEWTSSMDGGFGNGPSIEVSDLSIGSHTITASVKDSHGATGSASLDIEVLHPNGIGGTVFYASAGLGEVTVELVEGETAGAPAAQTTTTDADGAYTFPHVADGEYWVKAYGPSDAFVDWLASGVTVDGSSINLDIDLPKVITLLSPEDGAQVAGQPVLEWEENPDAASYTVQINATDGFDLIEHPSDISTNSYTVQAPLEVGESYTWQVDAYGSGRHVGTTRHTFTFRTGNSAPAAVDDEATANENESVLIDVRANDSDPDGDDLTLGDFTQGDHGSVDAQDGQLLYTPDEGFSGADEFTYQISDGNGGISTGTVTVTVDAVNHAPTAVDDNTTVDEDASVLIDVLANDSDPDGDVLTIDDFTQGDHGSVEAQDGQLLYTPDEGFSGADGFTYDVSDGNGGTSTATVTVTVNAVNHAPTAVDDNTTLDEDASVLINVLANDTDADDDALTIGDVTQGANGSVIKEDGQLLYTPDLDFNGTDSFTYEISDGNGGSATGTVTVTVNSINDLPSITITEPKDLEHVQGAITFSAAATDVEDDDDALTSSITWSSDSDLTLDAGPSVSVAPPIGTHTLTASVTDSDGEVDEASVTVEVIAANTAPTVSIVEPSTSPSVLFGIPVDLEASASDDKDEAGDLRFEWRVNGGEPFDTLSTATLSTETLSSTGTHEVEVRVIDTGELQATATLDVNVNAPGLQILEPDPGEILSLSGTHTFRAAIVQEDKDELGEHFVNVPATRWSHTLGDETTQFGDRNFQVEQAFAAAGTYTIKARIGNSQSPITSDSITVTVTTFPELELTASTVGDFFVVDVPITFTASVSDAEDEDLSSDNVVWTYALDDGEATPFTPDESGAFTFHDPGTYTISASITDSHGATTTAPLEIEVLSALDI